MIFDKILVEIRLIKFNIFLQNFTTSLQGKIRLQNSLSLVAGNLPLRSSFTCDDQAFLFH